MSWKYVQRNDESGQYRTTDEGGGGGGSSTFAGLDDVGFSNLQDGQVPKYNSSTGKWENDDESGGTVTDVEVDGVSVVNAQGVAEITIPTPSAAHHYSTNEQIVGTWIDGKPLYEKVLQFTNMTVINIESDSNTNIDLSSLNINVMVDFYGWYKRQWGTSSGQNRIAKFGYYEKSGSNMAIHSNLRWNNDSKRLEYCNVVPSGQTVPEATIIIQYTKTTD